MNDYDNQKNLSNRNQNRVSYEDIRPQIYRYLLTKNNDNVKIPFKCFLCSEEINENEKEEHYKAHKLGQEMVFKDIENIKENISEIKKELNNLNLGEIKSYISKINQINHGNEDIKNEILLIKEEMKGIKNLLYNLIKGNETSKNEYIKTEENKKRLDTNMKTNEIKIDVVPDRKITIWMDRKNHIFKVHDKMTLKEFIKKCIYSFKLNDFQYIIHYFNKYGAKYIIQDENDFQKSLDDKIPKYYLSEDKYLIKNLCFPYIVKNKGLAKNISNLEKIDEKNNDYEDDKKKKSEKVNHFASLATNEVGTKMDYFLNSADYVSDFMKNYNLNKKEKDPKKFINSQEIIKNPGLLSNENENDMDFILSLLAEILRDKNIDIGIYKNNKEEEDNKGKLYEASLQYLFCGLFDKKKVEIKFNFDPRKIDILNKKGDELSEFIEDWKDKISNQLNIDKNEIILINPKKKDQNSFSLDLVLKDDTMLKDIRKLSDFNEIAAIHEKSFIEACQLNNNIFDPNYNNQDAWGENEKRGGEDYIPPKGWKGYAINVKGKYDDGDNTWLDYIDREGVFAIAYLGLSNIYGNEKKYIKYLTEVNCQEILKNNYEQTYKNDNDLRNIGQKCGCGVYLYQDPKIAENAAGIIDILGVRYKILLMCRVNPKKIRQPQGYKNCWILNPSPDEIRPYRILIKKIFNSPLAGASQNEFKIFEEPSSYYQEIINKKDISFFKTNNTNKNNNDYVINLYTKDIYKYINGYLRNGIIPPETNYTEKQIKSLVWCLHDALTNKRSNVSNSSVFFRGLARPFPCELEVGNQFILGEFVSVSKNIDVGLRFSGSQTLLIIRIENNNVPPGFYCYDIHSISHYEDEEETLITSNCIFQITKKETKKIKLLREEYYITYDIDEDKEIVIVYLTCLGNCYDIKNTNLYNN